MKYSLWIIVLLSALVFGIAEAGTRPYEFDWANRTADDRPVLLPLDRADGWRVVGETAAAATLSTGTNRVLFGNGVMHVDYRAVPSSAAKGAAPSFRLVPPEPVAVPPGADTVSLWIWGNTVSYANRTPPVLLTLEFVDSAGKPFSLTFYRIRHLEWFLMQRRLSSEEQARLKDGGRFTGLTVSGGTSTKPSWFEFTSLAVYREELKPLTFGARAKRPNRAFPSAPAGANTGAGELAFQASRQVTSFEREFAIIPA